MKKCVLILLTFHRTQNFTVSQKFNVQCIWFWEKHGYFVTNKMLFVWFALHGSFILAVELLHLPRWSNHLHDRKSTALIHTAGHATKFYEATKTLFFGERNHSILTLDRVTFRRNAFCFLEKSTSMKKILINNYEKYVTFHHTLVTTKMQKNLIKKNLHAQ